MPFSLRPFIFLLSAALASASLHGAEIRLKNGDKLTAEILSRRDGKVVIRSELLGELSIPESAVVMSADGKGAAAEPQTAKLPVSAAQVPAPEVKPPAPLPKKLKGSVEFGLNSQSGRREALNFSLRADTEYMRNASQFKVSGRYLYGEAFGTLNSDRREASLRWRRQLNRRLFSQFTSTYMSDRVKSIDMNLEQSGGLGYAVLKEEAQVLNIGLGATGQTRYDNIGSEKSVILGDVFQDYAYKFNKRLILKQESSLQYSEMDQTSYSLIDGDRIPVSRQSSSHHLRFNIALQGKVTDTISLNLRYEHEFDNTIVDPSLRTDHRVTSSLGYSY